VSKVQDFSRLQVLRMANSPLCSSGSHFKQFDKKNQKEQLFLKVSFVQSIRSTEIEK
jgi:hypothetical protein